MSAVRSERAADVRRFFCTSAWLGVRSSGYALAGIQTSDALSERAAYSYQYPGFRFAPPWAEVSYAFCVPPENPQLQSLFYAKQIPLLATPRCAARGNLVGIAKPTKSL